MSYMSQKPSCKAKVEGRGGPRVTGVFSLYCGREGYVSVLRGRSQWRAMEFEDGSWGGEGLASGARSG